MSDWLPPELAAWRTALGRRRTLLDLAEQLAGELAAAALDPTDNRPAVLYWRRAEVEEMVSDDDKLWAIRRELAAVVRECFTRCQAAQQLLREKAERSPGSAEQRAHAEVTAAVQYVLKWCGGAKLILPAENDPDAPPPNETPPARR